MTKKLNGAKEDQSTTEIKDGSPLAILLLIQNAVHQRCSLFACSLLTRLTTHRNGETGLICPSANTLADHFGVDERHVRRGLKELKDAGFIFVKRRANASSLISLNWAMAVRADLKRQRTLESVGDTMNGHPESVTYQTERGNGHKQAEPTDSGCPLDERQRTFDDIGNGHICPPNLTEENLSEPKTNLSEATTLKGESEKTVKDNMEETNDQQVAAKEPPRQSKKLDPQLNGHRPPSNGNGSCLSQSEAEGLSVSRPPAQTKAPASNLLFNDDRYDPKQAWDDLVEAQEEAARRQAEYEAAAPIPSAQPADADDVLAFNVATDVSAAFTRFLKLWPRPKIAKEATEEIKKAAKAEFAKIKKAAKAAFTKLVAAGINPVTIIDRYAMAMADKPDCAMTPDRWLAQFRPPIIAAVETLLAIPFGNKETAEAWGARYMGNNRWYAPAGIDLAPFKARGWLPADNSIAAIAEENRQSDIKRAAERAAVQEQIRQEEEKLRQERAASLSVDCPPPAPAEPKEVERPNIIELFAPAPPLDLVAIAKAETEVSPAFAELFEQEGTM